MQKTKYHFFWGGPFSQWAKSPFTIDDLNFNTCEQWMMFQKAIIFGDAETAMKIIKQSDPKAQKALGRQVKNFDDDVWMAEAYDIVVAGNRAKFTQNPKLMDALRYTIGQELVEASPYDRRWGIGMAVGDPGIGDPKNWRGDNLLGKAITQVRIELLGE
jgi:ribA/ribD-fused uncharacterized protein